MIHEREKSDSAVVAAKSTNEAEQPGEEWMEPRAGAKGKCGPVNQPTLAHTFRIGRDGEQLLFCGRLALASICITARQPQGYRITFQFRPLAGFRLRSAK